MRSQLAWTLSFALAAPTSLFADFRYTETTQITGGSMLSMMKFAGSFSRQARQIGDPVTSSVFVKGNRMARIAPDHSEIIDLDAGTVTHIDHQRRQYYTLTFQQMKERMEAAQREAASHQNQREQASQPAANDTDVNFDVAVRNTGAHQQRSGLNTSESILTLTVKATDRKSGETGNLAMSNDLWLVPEIPGYREVRDFQMRYAQKLGSIYGAAFTPALAGMQGQMRAGSSQGLGQMAQEVSKLKGVPIYTVMRMGSTTDGRPLPAASEAPLPAGATEDASMPSKGDVAKAGASDAATSAIASKLGGLGGMMGGFGRHKKEPPPAAAAQPTADAQQPVSVLMETTTEMSGFSNAPIDAKPFQVPEGYRQVTPPEYRHSER